MKRKHSVVIVVVAALATAELAPAASQGNGLEQEVEGAIIAAATQTFQGTISFRQEAVYLPRPELLEAAAAFDPANLPQSADAKTNARLRQTYREIQDQMLRQGELPHFDAYDLAVTVGAGGAIRLDRFYARAAPRATALSGGQVWEYTRGGAILTTCDAEALEDPATVPAWALKTEISEARYVARLFVNQRMTPDLTRSLNSVEVADNGTVVAQLSPGEGPMTIHFARVDGALRIARITKHRDGALWHTSFDRYARVGDAWVARWVEYVEEPVGGMSADGILRRTTRTITDIRQLGPVELEAAFRPADPYDPAYPDLCYEHDVTVGGMPMVNLRED